MKKLCIIFLVIVLSILYTTVGYCEKISNDLQNNIFRLHIIANSDSDYDQNIKILVRDSIIEYMNKNTSSFNNLKDCINYFNNNMKDINHIVEKVLTDNNCDITFSCCISKEFFPTKKYDNYSFPTGIYNCLKIKLGNSTGQNWWCVLYPNLCIPNTNSKKQEDIKLKNCITQSSYDLVTSNISYKFKIVEVYEKIKNKY